MYEKNREASALAAISRAIAASPPTNAKPPQPDPAAISAPEPAPIAAAVKKSSKKDKKKSKKDRKEPVDNAERNTKHHRDDIAAELHSREAPSANAAPPAPPPSLPTPSEAFHNWYLAKIAENFEHEIEGLNEADAPVGSRVLLQSLESSIPLFTPAEQRVALAVEGRQWKELNMYKAL